MNGYESINISEHRESSTTRQPFFHQEEAFKEMSKMFTFPIKDYKGSMLVLPTGGGKTFTSINWICKNVLSRGIKVLWLAQSTYLLDQAAKTFKEEIGNVYDRDTINLRVVSSNSEHQNSGSILETDDILICTTQTAIKSYFNEESLDLKGNTQYTPFRKYVELLKDSELFIVIDEAHHSPAYGCRTLLLSIKEKIKDLYVLGLTATPMHTDKRISGCLWKIFDQGICYEAQQSKLQTAQILAVPHYIERSTGIEYEVDDKLYDRLVSKHKDLPEEIIEKLANNSSRNNFIVSDYINNKNEYGKTLIFADRWYQCEYIAQKLRDSGVRAECVYSKVDGHNELFAQGSGRRSNKDNDLILKDFRNDKYDVIVNVKMLTEGVDVPDVETVMVTRQTTSPVLFRQMIGRALRGKKAGGKDNANIVLFNDTWKRLLPWVDNKNGCLENIAHRQGRNPIELISIAAIREACCDIDFERFEIESMFELIPVGWYAAEFTVSVDESSDEELISVDESVLAYEYNKEKYDKLINVLQEECKNEWADEKLSDEDLKSIAENYKNRFFNSEKDNIDGNIIKNITFIIRHIAQNGIAPLFVDFKERKLYDTDEFVKKNMNVPMYEFVTVIEKAFYDVSMPWKSLYKTEKNFSDAFFNAMKRISLKPEKANKYKEEENKSDVPVVLTEERKKQVLEKDNNTCVCCGKIKRRGVKLEVDHIKPVAMGGTNDISNLQTLCRQCNNEKGTNEIDYRRTESYLENPKTLELYDPADSDSIDNSMARIVNNVYYCKAFRKLDYHVRSTGRNYHRWKLYLYSGNNPEWIIEHKDEIIEYLHELGHEQVEDVEVIVEG